MADKLVLKGVKSEGFGIIPKLVMKDRDLDVVAKCFYAYLCSYAGNGSTAFPSIEKICYDLNISEKRLQRHRKDLVKKGYISINRINNGGVWTSNIYTIEDVLNPVEVQNVSVQNVPVQNVPVQNGGTINNNLINNNTTNNSTNIKDNVASAPLPVSKEEDKYPFKEVIDYLNKSANKGFKYVASHKKHIIARFKEGFTLEDFKKVIEVKTHQWLNDQKLNTYLRPETLFGNKMDGYLQEYYKPNNGQKKYQQPTQQVTSIKQPSSFTPTEPDENGFNGCNFEISWIGKRNIDHNLIIHYYKEHIKNTGALLKSGGREITVQELIEEIEWDRKVKVSV